MPYQQSANKGLRDSLPKAKIRVLLALWDWDATENTAKKSDVMKWVKNSQERTKDYQPVLDQLVEKGAIAFSKNLISLTDRGLGMLDEIQSGLPQLN
jgi:predicted methyltransferase